jgi:hypothetical protein
MSTPLSPLGHERKRQILRDATGALHARTRRRYAVRALGAMLVVGAVGVGARTWNVRHGGSGGTPQDPLTIAAPPESPRVALPSPLIEIVTTGNVDLSRYEAREPRVRVEFIDDTTLLSDLAAGGTPDGLVRVGGRTMLSSDLLPKDKPQSLSPVPTTSGSV